MLERYEVRYPTLKDGGERVRVHADSFTHAVQMADVAMLVRGYRGHQLVHESPTVKDVRTGITMQIQYGDDEVTTTILGKEIFS